MFIFQIRKRTLNFSVAKQLLGRSQGLYRVMVCIYLYRLEILEITDSDLHIDTGPMYN